MRINYPPPLTMAGGGSADHTIGGAPSGRAFALDRARDAIPLQVRHKGATFSVKLPGCFDLDGRGPLPSWWIRLWAWFFLGMRWRRKRDAAAWVDEPAARPEVDQMC